MAKTVSIAVEVVERARRAEETRPPATASAPFLWFAWRNIAPLGFAWQYVAAASKLETLEHRFLVDHCFRGV